MELEVEQACPCYVSFSGTRPGINKTLVLNFVAPVSLLRFVLLVHNGYHSRCAIGAKWPQQKLAHQGTFEAEGCP